MSTRKSGKQQQPEGSFSICTADDVKKDYPEQTIMKKGAWLFSQGLHRLITHFSKSEPDAVIELHTQANIRSPLCIIHLF